MIAVLCAGMCLAKSIVADLYWRWVLVCVPFFNHVCFVNHVGSVFNRPQRTCAVRARGGGPAGEMSRSRFKLLLLCSQCCVWLLWPKRPYSRASRASSTTTTRSARTSRPASRRTRSSPCFGRGWCGGRGCMRRGGQERLLICFWRSLLGRRCLCSFVRLELQWCIGYNTIHEIW